MTQTMMRGEARAAGAKLLNYCRERNWAGHDPYDALNSRIFSAVPALDTRIVRLAATQALKRSPIDIRSLLFIPPTQNPKAIGLFLAAALRFERDGGVDVSGVADAMVERLVALRSPGVGRWCWGYSFPWQTRTMVVPRGTPNLVCTTFVATALLDAYEQRNEERCLDMARSAADQIVTEWYRSSSTAAGFSYPLPTMPSHIHNANFLAAALLCRVAVLTGDDRFIEPALAAARWSASRQHDDGSWPYGEGSKQQWVDNFHTGYNLGGLSTIRQLLGIREFDSHIDRGFEFYRNHFIREDGAARYFHDATYPIDVHCVAQTIITLTELAGLHENNVPLADKVLQWAMANMWDDRGFFYYRVFRMTTIRTSYMRWSQAWMLLALATLLARAAVDAGATPARDALAIA